MEVYENPLQHENHFVIADLYYITAAKYFFMDLFTVNLCRFEKRTRVYYSKISVPLPDYRGMGVFNE